ncbi:hypothetical protein BRI6_1096 [plant metagenome]|uniref:Mor transcription activator domain-containing protein n=1 Tax=plant metagenome TaxID=1297885 RepID=A0A484XNG4_9ZZZZ
MRTNHQLLTAAEVAALEAHFDEGYPEALRDIAQSLYAVLARRDDLVKTLTAAGLADLAVALTEGLSMDLGGRTFYLNKGAAFRLGPRNRRMCAEFHGTNYAELAKRYGLSDVRVRQIVDGHLRQHYLGRQGNLHLPE